MFKAKLNRLLLECAAAVLAGVLLIAWKGVKITWLVAILLLGYLSYRLFLAGGLSKTVTLRSDGLDIVPLFPWFKARRWSSDALASYSPVALKGTPFMGIVTPKEGKPETIWSLGTNQFPELDDLLRRLLPAPTEQETGTQAES